MSMTANPLTGPPPAEVPLPSAPLVRVIAQVRFPIVASIEKRDYIAPFQEAVRGDYAVMRQESASNLVVNLPGQAPVEVRSSTVWRFTDLRHHWRVTLAADFMALETSAYTSRTDFFARFERLLSALEQHVRPGALDRVGVRYIDRLVGAPLESLPAYIQPALLGTLGTAVGPLARVAVSESLFDLPDEAGQMRARWGVVPANATIDPNAIEPVDERSWVLDLDAFRQGERAFDVGTVLQEAIGLSERCYSFFRWSVTEEFLTHFGGTP
jgi:uncharacterized protein (TIGR04255 family)